MPLERNPVASQQALDAIHLAAAIAAVEEQLAMNRPAVFLGHRLIAKGKIYAEQIADAIHGENGVGS